jgi:hypothetical protein
MRGLPVHNTYFSMEFDQNELQEMKRFYSGERSRLIGQLNHVEAMLSKLTGSPLPPRRGRGAGSLATVGHKKRGPKSIWGDFIIKRLRARNRPMTYSELIEDAMAIHHLAPDKEASTRASILNSAFRLRSVHGRVETIGRSGKKEKYLILTKWLDSDGMLTHPYDEEFKALAGGKHVAVNMASLPTPRYDDETMGDNEAEVTTEATSAE